MAVYQVSTYTGNHHHGHLKTKESYSEKEGSIHDSTRSIKGETEGRYDKYTKDGKVSIHDMPDTHARFDRDAYTEFRHNEHNAYNNTTYTAKGAIKGDSTSQLISDYALVAKDANQKVGEAFEKFAKNPSDENRAKLEEAMIHKYKATEAFEKIKPFNSHWHGPFHMYRQEIKIPLVKLTKTMPMTHVAKPEKTLSPTEVTAAARDVLRNAYSSRRDGESGIKEIRAEAYKLYVNALSEEFKATGKIAHTNNTPSTPVHHHRQQHGQINLTYFAKIKDDTFKTLQNVIYKEKGGNWGEMSEARKTAFDSHMNSLVQWLKAGGKLQQNSISRINIRIIQPIKLQKASYNRDGHGQHFKVIDHRRDDDRRSYKVSNRHDDDRSSRTTHHRNFAEASRKANGTGSHATAHHKSRS